MPMDRNTGARITVEQHIDQCVTNILTTPTGVRPMDLDYGTDLIEIVAIPMNAEGRATIAAKTAGAVTTFETRPEIERITLSIDESDSGAFYVNLEWTYEGSDSTTTTEVV